MPVKIKKMTATFGGLEKATLTLGDGMTVITASNEAGKSTWAAFLKAMFYGIDTKERDKAGSLADKNRYQPWNGAPMFGEMQLEWNGRDITIRRSTSRSGPMQQFEAFYTSTGDPVPGLTGVNVGQELLGVSKDVFVRTALVGQNSAVITESAELERRVTALATSGEEDVSASATQRKLKDWRNRRRSNRANGLIPELEEELRSVEQALREYELSRSRKEEARQELERLTAEKEMLENDRELHRRIAQKELNRRCGEAKLRLEQAEDELGALPPADQVFEGLSAQQAKELAASLQKQAEERQVQQQQNGLRHDLQRKRNRIKALFKLTVVLLGFGGLALVIGGFVSKLYAMSFVGFGCMMLTVALAIVFVLLLGRIDQKMFKLGGEEPSLEETPVPDAEEYASWLVRRDALQREVRHCKERLDDLLAQGAQPLNTLELLPVPSFSQAETEARLSAVGREMALWQTQLDRAIGALRSDPQKLEARCGELEEMLKRRVAEYDSIDMAIEVLEQANTELREKFSPTLNRQAADIFSKMTGGKYHALMLSRDFSAMAGTDDTHSALYLSAGTVDQLYLSVRLALCQLTAPGVPVLLDDALSAFDDRRAEQALDVLREMGKERQILLFSCHSREARWAEEHAIPILYL